MRSERELKSQVLAKVADWRTTLRQEATEARLVLRHLLTDRISMEATQQDGRRCYRYAGAFTIGGLFEGFLRPQTLASPRGRLFPKRTALPDPGLGCRKTFPLGAG